MASDSDQWSDYEGDDTAAETLSIKQSPEQDVPTGFERKPIDYRSTHTAHHSIRVNMPLSQASEDPTVTGVHHSGSGDSTNVQVDLKPPTADSSIERPNLQPVELTNLVHSAGSPEAALLALWKEKHDATIHGERLLRLVEKQRSIILSLNRDIERTVKKKDVYKKNLKEMMSQAHSEPTESDVQFKRLSGISEVDMEHQEITNAFTAIAVEGTHALLKDEERDSGYASASRPGTLGHSSELTSEGGPLDTRKEEPEDHWIANDDGDLQSLVSDNDDIGSHISDGASQERITGQALIRVFLAEDPQFREICEKAMLQMSRARLVDNLRRLLKSFHRNLCDEAKSEAEKATARLLRSRHGRTRMSQQLISHIEQEQDDVEEEDRINVAIIPQEKHRVESWLAQAAERRTDAVRETDAQGVVEEGGLDALSSASESADEIDVGNQFPYISEVKTFLREANAFDLLLKDFMMLFLPTDLRHVILAIPREDIWISSKNDLTLLDKLKGWVEERTQVRWIWWPLPPHKKMLREGESRLFWRCTCGAIQWEESSEAQSRLLRRILNTPDNRPRLPHWCRSRRLRETVLLWLQEMVMMVLAMTSGTSRSAAAQRYIPPSNTTTTGSGGQNNVTAGSTQPTIIANPQTNRTGQTSSTAQAGITQSWILFGAQGARRALTPDQVYVNMQSTDSSVFQDLRNRYRVHRGWLRLWFSIWQLECCEVVKFNRLAFKRMVREYKDLPTSQEYQYTPRANNGARNPPISSHLFEALFYACQTPCTYPLPHDCMQPPNGSNTIERIPKRMRSFQRDQTSLVWGLEAIYAVSFAYVFVYHCIMVAGPFAFWAWWLSTHSGDWQNATAPATVVLGALSCFWAGAGILTNSKGE